MDHNLGLANMNIVYIDCSVFKVSPRSFGAFPIFPIFDNLVSRKLLLIEQKRTKIWAMGEDILIPFGTFQIFPILDNLVCKNKRPRGLHVLLGQLLDNRIPARYKPSSTNIPENLSQK